MWEVSNSGTEEAECRRRGLDGWEPFAMTLTPGLARPQVWWRRRRELEPAPAKLPPLLPPFAAAAPPPEPPKPPVPAVGSLRKKVVGPPV